jgi:hypothetical protein
MEKSAALPCLNFLTKKAPYKGLCAESVEKHEPASDIAIVVVDSLNALDPNRPIREADIGRPSGMGSFRLIPSHAHESDARSFPPPR